MIEIKIASDPRFLSIVHATVGELYKLLDCSAAEQSKIVLAVNEACSNIIKHTYHGDCGLTIDILCKGDEDKLEIVLQDCGPPVDIARIAPRDLDEFRPGGLGTHYICSIMDEVVYAHREGCGNVLRMVKHFHKDSS
jgi:phosphoserine phosphatase RsbU/P